jgi:hypothetical protein
VRELRAQDGVGEVQARSVAFQLGERGVEQPSHLVAHGPGNVRGEQHVRQAVQRGASGQHLGVGDVDNGLEAAGDQFRGERRLVDQ